MKTIVRSLAAMLARVALFILFFGASTLASSFGQCPAPYTLSAPTASENATTGTWTAPASGGPYLVRITAAGAQGAIATSDQGVGGFSGGAGAVITSTFIVSAGQTLNITAGAPGRETVQYESGFRPCGGGGGGSGVYIVQNNTNHILVIAGGGGGAGEAGPGSNGTTATCGTSNCGGSGGCNGNGGPGSAGYNSAGGGGGLLTNGGGGGNGGGSGVNGAGSYATGSSGSGGGGMGGGGKGGYGNGPGNGGGGGGYSGGGQGGTSCGAGGGGGGSINNGGNQTNTAGGNASGGYVIINCLGTATINSAGNNQTTTVNTAFATPLSVTLLSSGNPVVGASVTFTAPASGASGAFSTGTNTKTVVTDANGVASAGIFTANGLPGGPYMVTAAQGATALTTFNFTNTPVTSSCPSTYTLSAASPSVNATLGSWTAPAVGGPFKIKITAGGAQGGSIAGGNTGGKGAQVTGQFIINSGETINITAGAPGGYSAGISNGYPNGGGGGGSGAYIMNGNTTSILLIAGGGGGAGVYQAGTDGVTTTNGDGFNGGTNGNGGGQVQSSAGASGGGFLTAGFGPGQGHGGGAGFNGTGGLEQGYFGQGEGVGGNGGGGIGGGGGGSEGAGSNNVSEGGGGGGGGYSGGGGSGGGTGGAGYGGGSINNGTSPVNTSGANAGGGYVTIQCLGLVNQPTTTTITSSLNPSCFGSNVAFTATVLINGNAGTPATTGTATFTEGTTVLADNVALDADGKAAFSTDALGAGSHTIVATYNPSAGFTTSNGAINQVVNTPPVVSFSGLASSYCVNAGAATLTGNPTGGTFSGTGISGNTFDPATAGVGGPYTINYSYTDGSGCSNASSQQVTVNALPAVSFSGLASSYCVNAGAATLTGNPTGGTFSGTGISGNTFDPATAGVGGPYTINYSYTDGNGCSNASSQQVTVNALPAVSFSGLASSYCVNAGAATLTGNPTGGTFSGTGISGNTFDPSAAGAGGPYTITYSNTDGNGCSNSNSQQVTVNALPAVSFSGLASSYCVNAGAATLTGNPTGGTFSGTGISGNRFDPSVAGAGGPYTITYSYTDGNGCSNSNSQQVTVKAVATGTISGTNAVCVSAPSPNITFTGSGGTEPYTFTYTVNDGATQMVTTSNGSSVTVAVPTGSAGAFTYKLLSVSDASPSQCTQSISGQTAMVTVNGLPAGTISGSTSVCQNNSSPNITFSGSGGTPPYIFNYTLYDGSTTTSYTVTGNPATVTVPTTTAGNYTYTLVSVQDASASQCSQTVSNQSATVAVNPLPGATITTESMVTAASPGNMASVPDAGTGATYIWGITNGTITAGAGTRSITYTAGNSGSVNLIVSVTGSGGCGPVNGSAVVPITPLPCPNPAISVAFSVCSASAGNIASVANAGTGATYVWSITNGTITSGTGTRQITFTAATYNYFNYNNDYVYLSVKVTNASGGCALSSGTYKIFISPIPSAVISSPSSVCSLSSGNIASVAFACNGANYKWSITNGTITGGSGTRCITYTAGATGSVTLSVTVTNNSGCSASGTKQVTIAGLPVTTITTVSSVCSGSCSHAASVPNGGTGTKYAWSISNGSINSGCNSNSITYSAGAAGSITLTVIVTNASGCKASSGNKVVTIIALPNPTITAVASICAGSAGNAASVASAGTGASYAWTVNGGTITSGSGTSSIKYTAGTLGYVTLTVTVTNSNGCKATYSKRITTISSPAGNITASSSVCGGSTGNTASVSNAGTGTTYAWSITGGIITSGGTTSSIKFTAGSSGTIALSITITNSTGCKVIGTKTVTISAATIPSFAQIASLCQKSTPPSLPVKSNNGITGTWNPAKISTSLLATTTYTFTPAAGQCATVTTMKITVKNCTTLSNNDIVSGNEIISETAPAIDAVILPNPSENYFTLVIKGNRKEVAEVRVLDIQGRWLDHFRIPAGSRIQFGGNYAHGTYIVQVLQGTDQKILKAIKQ